MLINGISEVKTTAATLRTGYNKQVGKSMVMDTQEGFCALFAPLILQRYALAARDHVKGRSGHPLKTRSIDQYIQRIGNALVHHTLFVNTIDTPRRGIHQGDMGKIKRWQIFIMKSWALTSIRIVGF